MEIELFSLDQAPRSLPTWHMVMDDLSNPPAARVARVLGVSVRSVYRYNRGHAPRMALLALYWLTRWGRSAVHTQATNDALVACAYVAGLRRQLEALEAESRHLRSLSSYGSANDPIVWRLP